MRVRQILLALFLGVTTTTVAPRHASAQAAKKTDLTGKWVFSVTSSAGTGTPTVTMKQQGDSLAGHYSSQTLGEVDFKGSVKDATFTFVMNADVQGNALVVTYKGTIEGEALKGTVDFGGAGSGTFTGKRS